MENFRLRYGLTLPAIGSTWPAFIPVAIVAAGFWLIAQIARGDLLIEHPIWNPTEIVGKEAAARYWVATSLLLLIAAAGVAVATAVGIGLRNLDWRKCCGRLAIIALLMTAIYVLIYHLDGPFDLACNHLYDCLGSGLFESTIGIYPSHAADLSLIETIVNAGNVAGIVASAFVAVAVATLIPDASPALVGNSGFADASEIDKAAAKLARKVRDLKYLLFAAAAVLFAGVVQMKAWRDWPLAFFPSPDTPYTALADASVNFQAFHSVLILAAIFVPTAIRLHFAADELSKREPSVGKNPTEREKWMVEHGIAIPYREQGGRIFALITPFLASPLVETAQKFAGYFYGT